MTALIVLLGEMVAKIFTDKVIGWVALKIILIGLFTLVLPLILNNFLYDIIEIFLNFAGNTSSSASTLNGSMSFSGFGAWLIECFKISECISVVVSALLLRQALSMIPMIRI